MDNLIEQVVKKDRTADFYIKKAVTILLAILIPITVFLLAILKIITAYFIYIAIFLVPIAIYVSYIIITSLNIEYEYTLLSSTFTVDKIINKSRRKKILKMDVKDTTDIFKYTDDKMNSKKINKFYYVSDKEYSNDNYVLCYHTEARGNCAIVFKPKEELLKAIKVYLDRELQKKLSD